MKFVRKPDVVDAVEFFPDHGTPPGVQQCNCASYPKGEAACSFCGAYFIVTWAGALKLRPGDWIITHSDGDRSVLGPTKFKELYELAEKKS